MWHVLTVSSVNVVWVLCYYLYIYLYHSLRYVLTVYILRYVLTESGGSVVWVLCYYLYIAIYYILRYVLT